MASWWEFAKRHKGKLLVSSALIGGAIAASTLWEKQTTKFEEQPQNSELKLQARRHYVFDTNQRSCDATIVDLAPEIRERVRRRFDVDALIARLDKGNLDPAEKIQIWTRIKVLAVARVVGLASAYSLLIIALKAQISILAGEIVDNFGKTPSEAGILEKTIDLVNQWWTKSPPKQRPTTEEATPLSTADIAARQVFLLCIQYFNTQGLAQLLSRVEAAAEAACAEASLSASFSREKLRSLLDSVVQELEEPTEGRPSVCYSELVAPGDMDGVPASVAPLLTRLIDALDSPAAATLVRQLFDFYFTAVLSKFPDEKSEPLARRLPVLSSAFELEASTAFDAPLQQALLSADVHRFAINIFNRKDGARV